MDTRERDGGTEGGINGEEGGKEEKGTEMNKERGIT